MLRTRFAERLAAALASVSLAWALSVAAAAVLLALDLALAPSGEARALAAGALGASSAVLVVFALVSGLGRRFSDRWLARRIEARFPILDGRLLALVSERRRSPAVDAFAPGLAQDLAKCATVAVPSRAKLHRSGFLALIATVLGAGVLLAYARTKPAQLGRALALQDEPGPAGPARLLAVRPGAIKVQEGQGASIEIGYAGEPREAKLLLLPRDPARRAEGREVALTAVAAGRLAATLPALVEDASYQVAIDEQRSAVFAIDVVHPPRIVAVSHREEAPSYLELEPREVAGGDVDAIEGTKVLVRATTSSEPLHGKIRAQWISEGLIESIPLAKAGPRTLEGTFVAKHGGTYRIEYEDATGLAPRESATFQVAVRPDLPPRAEILAPAADREIGHASALVVEYEVRDDHGLGSLALHVAVKGGKAKKLALPVTVGARVAKGKLVLSPKQLGLLPGDSLLYYVVAEDRKAPIPNRGASPPYVLVVEEDGALRSVLTGIDPRDDEMFRGLESTGPDDAPESEEELARNMEALRRLEALVNRQPETSEAPDATDDPLQDLAPQDEQELAKALEDLDMDEDQLLEPPQNGQKGAEGQGDKDQKGDPKGQGQAGQNKGKRGKGAGEARGQGGKSFLMRVARKDLVRRYRELLSKRRELLRKLAEQVALGKPLDAALAQKLGPDGARLLDALKGNPLFGAPDSNPMPHATETQKGRLASGFRTIRMRDEIPHDAVELAPRTEETAPPEGTPGSVDAPAWDEELPSELRQVVRQYFKTR